MVPRSQGVLSPAWLSRKSNLYTVFIMLVLFMERTGQREFINCLHTIIFTWLLLFNYFNILFYFYIKHSENKVFPNIGTILRLPLIQNTTNRLRSSTQTFNL